MNIGLLAVVAQKLLGAFGIKKQPDFPESPIKYLYMRRACFVIAVVFCGWALVDPEGLGIRLERASDVIPEWFYSMLAVVFAGVW